MKDLEKIKNMNELAEAFLLLKNLNETKLFLRDLCTIKELQSISERFQVMKMVNEGIPYRTITKQTGVSTATVTRVAHWLKYGTGGYRLMLKKLEKK
jgi:TrpR-related protein YerC/YecD